MFKNKTVVITGASSGLGAALAIRFAKEGARLSLFARNREGLEQTVARCHEISQDPLVVTGCISDPEKCKELIDRTVETFGSIDYFIANAGQSMWARFDEIEDLEIFRKLMEVNYLGVVYCMHYAMPHLIDSKGQVVAISSIQGKLGVPYHTGYCASKHALQGFIAGLRTELSESGVHLLTVMPSWVKDTNLRANAFGKDGRAIGEQKRKHSRDALSPEVCCQEIIRAMETRKRELIMPPKLRWLTWLSLAIPDFVDRLIIHRTTREPE